MSKERGGGEMYTLNLVSQKDTNDIALNRGLLQINREERLIQEWRGYFSIITPSVNSNDR